MSLVLEASRSPAYQPESDVVGQPCGHAPGRAYHPYLRALMDERQEARWPRIAADILSSLWFLPWTCSVLADEDGAPVWIAGSRWRTDPADVGTRAAESRRRPFPPLTADVRTHGPGRRSLRRGELGSVLGLPRLLVMGLSGHGTWPGLDPPGPVQRDPCRGAAAVPVDPASERLTSAFGGAGNIAATSREAVAAPGESSGPRGTGWLIGVLVMCHAPQGVPAESRKRAVLCPRGGSAAMGRRAGLRPAAVGCGHVSLIAGAVIVVAAVAWVAVQLLRPVPPMALAASVTTVRVLPGVAPRPDWPGRAEAAVGLPGTGLLGAHGGSAPVPIASLAKIMTAYVVLGGHPLPAGRPGPAITVTAADAAAYASDQRQGPVGRPGGGRGEADRAPGAGGDAHPLREQHRRPAGPLGRGLGTGVRGEDERPGALARAARHAVRRRQRRGPGHGEHGRRPVPAHPARAADPGVPPDRGHAAGHAAGRGRGV